VSSSETTGRGAFDPYLLGNSENLQELQSEPIFMEDQESSFLPDQSNDQYLSEGRGVQTT
jgi:hypothetical protein